MIRQKKQQFENNFAQIKTICIVMQEVSDALSKTATFHQVDLV